MRKRKIYREPTQVALDHINVGGGQTSRIRHGGSDPPVVLLHGHPRAHASWYAVARLVAAGHSAICPGRCGYGGSSVRPVVITTRHECGTDVSYCGVPAAQGQAGR